MPKPVDTIIPVSKTGIPSKSNPASVSLRAVVITNNKKKFEEFRTQLADGYGMDVQQWEVDPSVNLDDEATLTATCTKIMEEQAHSPHFILREETSLVSQKTQADLTTLPLADLAKRKLEPVLHTSSLRVFKPQWTGDEKSADKALNGFSLRHYEKRSYGYITRENIDVNSTLGFGWDKLFVNAATNLSNEEFFKLYGKKSARQHTTSDFIESYLRYKTLVSLKHHPLPLTKAIDFGNQYICLPTFMASDKHFSNPHVAEWGIDKLRNAKLNEGLFIKAAWDRRVKNYFLPPFSGLPLTAKKDDAEETIFMTHDMLHHLICDLTCDTEPTKENFHVYSAWRMSSEACTMVLADMFYADGLVKSGVARSCVDSRIYPLFESIKKTQNVPDPTVMAKEDKIAFIRKLLYANVIYALLGDDSEWVKLLTPVGGTISEESNKNLQAYKNHFGKFFIGDNAWTRANFDNMHKHNQPLKEWISSVGKDQFRAANVPLLSDIAAEVAADNNGSKDYKAVVESVFNIIFTQKIKPHLDADKIELDDSKTLQSRAFRRFLIGQTSLLTRYPVPHNLGYIKEELFARIADKTAFSIAEQDEIRAKLEQYIRGLEGLRLISMDEADSLIDCSPVFPPVYISYPQMQKQYGTIARCVDQCIESFGNTVATLHGANSNTFLANKPIDKAPAQAEAAATATANF